MSNPRVITTSLFLSLIVLVAGSCSHIGSNAIVGDASATGNTGPTADAATPLRETQRTMKRVIDNVHILIDNNLGQDYVFGGCMAYLMECLGESEAYDYWFFAGVSGDSYTQVYERDLSRWTPSLSRACFDQHLMDRVFGAAGYGYSFVDGTAIGRNQEAFRSRVVESIDQGIPVIAKGFDYTWNGKIHRNWDIGCIVGYEDAGDTLLYVSQDLVTPSPHMAQDPIVPRAFTLDSTFTLVFVGEKTHSPPLESVYREAIRNIVRLNRMADRGSVSFGTKAFEQWAADLESGRPDSLPVEELDFWHHYGGYLVTLYTNMYGQHFTQRAIEACPNHAGLSEVPAGRAGQGGLGPIAAI
jgi:hypothetical protein